MVAAGRRPRIAVLPPAIAARIAAGEVIERPASVVKELIENALDAGATRIEVLIAGGGVERIRVRDDGHGIPADQVADAFERHATSKLRRAEELYDVATLGFRGEALASIAAAADVDLTTRPPGETAAATARLRDGQLERLGAAAAAPGTTVEVRELFAALPARRRFLRSATAEARAVTQVVSEAALANPSVAFRLESEGRELLAAPGGVLRDAIRAVHGGAVADALLPVEFVATPSEEPSAGEDSPAARVEGLIGPPALHRGNRRYLHLIVNGRPIGSRALIAAIEQGYQGLMPAGRHPVGVLAITVPGPEVDVNVHPTKAEVRFRHERFVFAAVRRAVLDALAALPTAAVPGAGWLSAARPFEGASGPRSPVAPASGRDILAAARSAALPPSIASPAASVAPPLDEAVRADSPPPAEPDSTPAGVPAGAPALLGNLPALRPLGQIDGTYIVAEAPDGLVLIDQHAAHERVLYEQIMAARATSGGGAASDGGSQPLLAPALVELSAPQSALAAALHDELTAVGWSLEAVDGRALLIRAVPRLLHGDAVRRGVSVDPARALREQLDAVEAEERLTGPDLVVATLACRAAVRAGDPLAAEQQRALLSALEAAETPQSCPHGRPTMLHLTDEALARAFGRT